MMCSTVLKDTPEISDILSFVNPCFSLMLFMNDAHLSNVIDAVLDPLHPTSRYLQLRHLAYVPGMWFGSDIIFEIII